MSGCSSGESLIASKQCFLIYFRAQEPAVYLRVSEICDSNLLRYCHEISCAAGTQLVRSDSAV